jgi:hypothetical protein
MEDAEKFREQFYQRILGEWEFENNEQKEKIRITISGFYFPGRLIQVIDGKEIQNKTFIVPHDWFGNWMVAGSYFIEYTNQDVLIFGESNSAVIGHYDWKYTFHRVKV